MDSLFEKALENSNIKQAAEDLYQLYQELLKAGFTQVEAMTLMVAMIQNGRKNE